ncbi:RHS repeat-associated core domain-containing protein [Ralstonia mannitolilytica]|uniref:RHS repeat-associated core domain-containing protein n=2 Tax=Ralstonia mannitolilytica TaxID=105219 RepID=UPI003B83BF19
MVTGPRLDEPYLRETSAGTHSLLPDALGSILMATDAAQATVTSYSYDAYGATLQTGTNDNSQQYTGRENDGTGLYYYRARYYSPQMGRFISQDPIGWASGQTNNYAYVKANPINFADPYGLKTAVILSDGIGSNPFGHIGVATSGGGAYSYGTKDPYGESIGDYLNGQLQNRNVEVAILDTTPEQEAQIEASVRGNTGNYSATSHNCATAVGNALDAAGITSTGDPSIFPGRVFIDALSLPGAQYVNIPRGGRFPLRSLLLNEKYKTGSFIDCFVIGTYCCIRCLLSLFNVGRTR